MNEQKHQEMKPLTREGFFAYFDQAADENGQIITTADWLADVAMLIVHEARNEAALPSGDLREAVEVVPCPNCGGTIRCVECGSETFPPVLAHVTDWVEITDEDSLPQEGGDYLWRLKKGGYRVDTFMPFTSLAYYVDWYSHYKRITPPTFEEDNDNAK